MITEPKKYHRNGIVTPIHLLKSPATQQLDDGDGRRASLPLPLSHLCHKPTAARERGILDFESLRANHKKMARLFSWRMIWLSAKASISTITLSLGSLYRSRETLMNRIFPPCKPSTRTRTPRVHPTPKNQKTLSPVIIIIIT